MRFPLGTMFTLENGTTIHVIIQYSDDESDVSVAINSPEGQLKITTYKTCVLEDVLLSGGTRYIITYPSKTIEKKDYNLPEDLFKL